MRPSWSEHTTPMIEQVFTGRCGWQALVNGDSTDQAVSSYCSMLWTAFKNATAVPPTWTDSVDRLKTAGWESGPIARRFDRFLQLANWTAPDSAVLLYSGVAQRPLS